MRIRLLGLLIPTLMLSACATVDAVLNPNIKVYDVPGASMEPGIQPGTKIEALRVTNDKPRLGDVVVALTPKSWGQGPGFKTIRRVLGTPGELWLMGDNRGDSSDSRAHMQDPGGPFVPVANVVAVYKRR